MGLIGSTVLHTLILLSITFECEQTAFDVVVCFIGCIHVPLHYLRCYQKERYMALLIAGFSTCVSVFFSHKFKLQHLVFTDRMQKVVISHIVVELLVKF